MIGFLPDAERKLFLMRAILFNQAMWMLFSLIFAVALVGLYLWDRNQKHHSVLRTYPIVGHFRYILEYIGEFLRQYLFTNDREELPFNRAERNWVYRASKNVDTTIGFGSTRPLHEPGTVFFVSAPFPPLGTNDAETRDVTIGPYCAMPYTSHQIFNISAMSYGSISKQAILALGRGAKKAGCWLNTGEGGVAPYH